MKRIFSGIVTFTWCIGCLALPTNLEIPIGYLRFENSTETAILKNETNTEIDTKLSETQPLELKNLENPEESKVIQIKILENTDAENQAPKDEKPINSDEIKTAPKHSDQSTSSTRVNLNIGEEHKSIESRKDVAHDESDVWKDFENDFSLLEHRYPDLNDEDFSQLNKEGSIPWNYLKSIHVKRNANVELAKPELMQTPIYITVPIVINTHSTLPISLTIGGQNVPLAVTSDKKVLSVPAPSVKVETGSAMVSPTSDYNKLMNYAEPPARETNRHRSNLRQKIYARNNNHEVQAFEYNTKDFEK